MTDPAPPRFDYDAPALAAAAEALGLRLVLAFGSRASRSGLAPGPESDLDLAVLATPARRVAVADVLAALAPAFPGSDLDVAILNDADPVFLDEVFRCPDLLFGDPDLFAEREAHAYRFFMESADLRAHERALSADKLARLLDAAA